MVELNGKQQLKKPDQKMSGGIEWNGKQQRGASVSSEIKIVSPFKVDALQGQTALVTGRGEKKTREEQLFGTPFEPPLLNTRWWFGYWIGYCEATWIARCKCGHYGKNKG